MQVTLPEAIVYLLASSNHGMKTDQIARLVNEKGFKSNDRIDSIPK
jgi:hypothetical protein